MDFAKLSYEQVVSIAEQLKTSATNMENLLTEVKTLFENVGNDGVWSGTAASTTKEQFDALSAKFPQFSQAVNDCHQYLLSVVENYKAVDTAINGQM